jgi:hypothetical protein
MPVRQLRLPPKGERKTLKTQINPMKNQHCNRENRCDSHHNNQVSRVAVDSIRGTMPTFGKAMSLARWFHSTCRKCIASRNMTTNQA